MTRPESPLSHVLDDRLVECYLATRLGELPDPPVAEHLAECRTCERRFDALVRLLDGARADADQEFDALFPADRLRAHQLHIGRRLEQFGRPARVLPFRAAEAEKRHLSRHPRVMRRWLAAAAAVGLAAGIGVNALRGTDARRPRVPVTVIEPARPVSVVPASASGLDGDDPFLSELEHAADGPRAPSLEALDALTPHLVEVSASIDVC